MLLLFSLLLSLSMLLLMFTDHAGVAVIVCGCYVVEVFVVVAISVVVVDIAISVAVIDDIVIVALVVDHRFV